jgi:hypothetical protein
MYFGAGLNKICEADWRSGVYFEYWMHEIIHQKYYIWAASLLPHLMLSKLMCWLTIATEFSLAAGFLIPRTYFLTIWLGIYFHAMALVMTTVDFGIFTTAVFASYLTVVPWPEQIKVFYNPRNYLCSGVKAFINFFDVDRQFAWEAINNDGHRHWQTSIRGKLSEGFCGIKKVLFFLPLFYFGLTGLLCISQDQYELLRTKGIEFLLIVFCPAWDWFCAGCWKIYSLRK